MTFSVGVIAGPYKEPSEQQSEEAIGAGIFFWQAFQNGLYHLLPDVLNALTGVYLRDPNDSITAGYLAAAHAWKLSERARFDEIPPTITDHATLARKYFAEKVRMEPDNSHFIGFLGSLMMSEGDVHADERLIKRGFKTLLKASRMHPEFNYVTTALTISGGMAESLPTADSKLYKLSLEWQWDTMELCFGEDIDRDSPDVSAYLHMETHDGPQSVCWNSEIAPHKFEGFFLNMGDMLVKAGDWQTAQKIYANARLSKTYNVWQFAPVLEQRIVDAEINVDLFNKHPGPNGKFEKPMMAQSEFSCTGCHQH